MSAAFRFPARDQQSVHLRPSLSPFRSVHPFEISGMFKLVLILGMRVPLPFVAFDIQNLINHGPGQAALDKGAVPGPINCFPQRFRQFSRPARSSAGAVSRSTSVGAGGDQPSPNPLQSRLQQQGKGEIGIAKRIGGTQFEPGLAAARHPNELGAVSAGPGDVPRRFKTPKPLVGIGRSVEEQGDFADAAQDPRKKSIEDLFRRGLPGNGSRRHVNVQAAPLYRAGAWA